MFPLLRRALLLFTLVLALAAAAGCGGGSETAAEEGEATDRTATTTASKSVPADAIVLVGDEKITKAEFDALLAQAEKSYETNQQEFPQAGTADYEALKNQAVQYLVQRVEFRQQAAALGITISDAEVTERLDQLKQQFGGDEKTYEEQLAQQGLTDEQLRTDIRAQLVSEKLFEAVTKDVQVTDADIDKYYEENPAQFTEPASRDVRHILVQKKEKADEIYAEIRAGGDFAELAKKFSRDEGSKDQGGKLTIRKGETVPEFDKTAFELDTGELAAPVKTEFGWHVIEALSEVKPESVTPLADVREAIRGELLQQKQNETATEWVENLEAEYAGRISYAVGYAPPAEEPAGTGSGDTTGTGAQEPAGSTSSSG